MLKILYIPRIHTTSKLTGVSGFNTMRWIFEELGRRGLVSTVVWLGQGLDISGLLTDEVNIKYEFGSRKWKKSKRVDTVETDDKLIASLHDKRIIADIIITDFQFTSPYHSIIQYESQFGLNIPETIPIITYFTEGVKQPQLQYFKIPSALPQLALSKLAGDLCFISESCKKDFISSIRTKFSPSFLKTIMDSYVMLPTLDTNETDYDAIYDKNILREKDGFLLFNASAPNKTRRMEIIIDAIGKARILGAKIKMRYYTQMDKIPDLFDKDFIETKKGISRNELIKKMYESDIVYDGTIYEGTGLFLWESIMSGSLPIIYEDSRSSGWLKGRIPHDYPLVAHNSDELVHMLISICNTKSDKYIKIQKKIRDFTKSKVDQTKNAELWYKYMKEVIMNTHDDSVYKKGIFSDIIKASLYELDGEYTTKEIGEVLSRNSKNGLNPQSVLSNIGFRRLMQANGFVDVGCDYEKWKKEKNDV